MLRLIPVCNRGTRAQLTDNELGELLLLYVERQTTGKDSRAAKAKAQKRRDIVEKYQHAIRAAKAEHDGMMWLMDHDIPVDNVIYYTHTEKFCFGWRQPMERSVISRLLDILSEFQWDYEIKEAK
jgi:hypothetical protein